jgi:pimeloyl-ACP methyl ester carboxylesterase
MPDPDAPTFTPEHDLPYDTTIEQLRWTRENYRKMFHPDTPNPEGLDRSNLASLLPMADSPELVGPDKLPVLLTVVGHDPHTFAEESLRISTRGLTEHYLQPAWHTYNEGLLKIGQTVKGVVTAERSGHFVQRDNPQCVVDEAMDLLIRIRSIK